MSGGYERFRDATGETPVRTPSYVEPVVLRRRPDPAGYLVRIKALAEMIGPLPAGEISARRWREMSPQLRRLAELAVDEVAKLFQSGRVS